jgi:hypothetical protein
MRIEHRRLRRLAPERWAIPAHPAPHRLRSIPNARAMAAIDAPAARNRTISAGRARRGSCRAIERLCAAVSTRLAAWSAKIVLMRSPRTASAAARMAA